MHCPRRAHFISSLYIRFSRVWCHDQNFRPLPDCERCDQQIVYLFDVRMSWHMDGHNLDECVSSVRACSRASCARDNSVCRSHTAKRACICPIRVISFYRTRKRLLGPFNRSAINRCVRVVPSSSSCGDHIATTNVTAIPGTTPRNENDCVHAASGPCNKIRL